VLELSSSCIDKLLCWYDRHSAILRRGFRNLLHIITTIHTKSNLFSNFIRVKDYLPSWICAEICKATIFVYWSISWKRIYWRWSLSNFGVHAWNQCRLGLASLHHWLTLSVTYLEWADVCDPIRYPFHCACYLCVLV
jgi:hypothetical protein